jgi:acetate kinase
METLVFASGIGENARECAARICNGLEFLGVQLDQPRNAANAPVISNVSSRATVRVIRTDEELMIARAVGRLLREQTRDQSNAIKHDWLSHEYLLGRLNSYAK